MRIIDCGHGDPIIAVPGIQGRPEYLEPALHALSGWARVVTFPLCDEPTAGAPYIPAHGMDNFAEQIARTMDDRRLDRAAICGVSFGGLAALRFAARWPDRTKALVLVSVPGPQWHLKQRHDLYARFPRLFGPVFALEAPWRLRAEIATAFPDLGSRVRFAAWQLRTLLKAPVSFARMASRARLISAHDRLADCALVSSPTLVVHGDASLDHVVDADGTCAYGARIRNARAAGLPGTGHLGSITHPDDFSKVVRNFLGQTVHGAHDSAA